MQRALSDIKIIDLTHFIAGPYCTKLLAGFGADVIKIERTRTGDPMRSVGPFYKNTKGLERSIPFLWLNTGKKSITLDLKNEDGRAIFKRLVKSADAVIENYSPGVMEKLGLEYESLREVNPRIVMTSISNFGRTGPYRDYRAEEVELSALCGGMYLTGDPGKAPLTPGPAVCQYTAGLHAYTATLMALFQRASTGKGQFVDVSIHESALENIEIALSSNLQAGTVGKRGGHVFAPWDVYECEDGYAPVIAMPYRHWRRAAEIFDDPALFDQKYDRIADRLQQRSEYESLLKACVKKHKKKDLFNAGQTRNLAFGYVASLAEAMTSPQHREREFFAELEHPETGKHDYCGAPFKMSRTPWNMAQAPLLGEHNKELLGGVLGLSGEQIQALTEKGII